jgi:hypothetical protein
MHMATNSTPLESIPEPGVFLHLVNRRAFTDKIIISIWQGKRRQPPIDVVAGLSRPIGGRINSVYARSLPLIFYGSRNEGDLRYGKLRPLSRIPDAQLILRSVEKPLDEEQVGSALEGLFVGKYRTTVAQVELTFDTVGTSIPSLQNSAITKARRFLQLRDPLGNETLYIGGPGSKWQLRIYQKTREIIRIEFVLRRQFLRDQGILTYEDLTLLGGLDLRQMASFMDLSRARLRQALAPLPSGWQKAANLDWLNRRPLQLLVLSLRRDEQINLEPLLRDSEIQRTIDRMRAEFIW